MRKFFPVIIIAVIILIIIYSLQGGKETPESYKERILGERQKVARFMKNSDESPFADTIFSELYYYGPDPEFRVKARLTPVPEKKLYQLPATNGGTEKYIRYAYADFELKGKNLRLLILEPWESNEPKQLFVPFADETSGNTTYGGGRYLNVEKPTGNSQANSILLDFNLAYNPYCAYNSKFVCPIPPKENYLDISIEAGEKTYH